MNYLDFKLLGEGTKIVSDGSVHNVHHDGTHVGNIMDASSEDKKKGYKHKAYSNHWNMKQLHKSKASAVRWLVDVHKQAGD